MGHYIKERTKNAQFVIISLRNNMFELADRLVGIYKTDNATKSVAINPGGARTRAGAGAGAGRLGCGAGPLDLLGHCVARPWRRARQGMAGRGTHAEQLGACALQASSRWEAAPSAPWRVGQRGRPAWTRSSWRRRWRLREAASEASELQRPVAAGPPLSLIYAVH